MQLNPAYEPGPTLGELAAKGLRLPDYPQHCPEPDPPVQVGSYFARDGLPGVCVSSIAPLTMRRHEPTTIASSAVRCAIAATG